MIHYVRRSVNLPFGSTIKMKVQPNPKPHTNSEMDSKTILPKTITYKQRLELIEQFVEIQVDNMDVKTMMQYITWSMKEDYANLSDDEIQTEIETYDEDLYDELLDNVTQEQEAK